jgi:hypothetical protein
MLQNYIVKSEMKKEEQTKIMKWRILFFFGNYGNCI